jgi:hypothetical protein
MTDAYVEGGSCIFCGGTGRVADDILCPRGCSQPRIHLVEDDDGDTATACGSAKVHQLRDSGEQITIDPTTVTCPTCHQRWTEEDRELDAIASRDT